MTDEVRRDPADVVRVTRGRPHGAVACSQEAAHPRVGRQPILDIFPDDTALVSAAGPRSPNNEGKSLDQSPE